MTHEAYLSILCQCHVSLDVFPFGGGVTIMDSLFGCSTKSIPVVTLPSLQVSISLVLVIDSLTVIV